MSTLDFPGTSFAASAGVWHPKYGQFISDNHRRLAELIHDYNEAFSLVFIPENARQGEQFPFAIVQEMQNAQPVIIRYLDEAMLREPEKVLAWLWEGDLRRQRPVDLIDRMDLQDAAQHMLIQKQRREEREEQNRMAAFLASGGRNRLHTVKHNGKKFEV